MIRKITLALVLAAVICAPVTLYASSAWAHIEPDMAAPGMIGRAVDLTGLLATSFLAVTLVLMLRLRALTGTVAHPDLAAIHRYFGILTVSGAATHLGLLVLSGPRDTLYRVTGTPAGIAGSAALGLLLVLTASSRLAAPRRIYHHATTHSRQRFATSFRARHPDAWRRAHLTLAVTASAASGLHVWLLAHMIESPPYRTLLACLAGASLLALLYRFGVRPATDTPYRVLQVRRLTPSLICLTLAPPRHHAAPSFRAGQFAYLRLASSPLAPERPFTISSSHTHPGSLEFTVRVSNAPRAFTRALTELKPGARVWVDGPHGTLGRPITDTNPGTLPDNTPPPRDLLPVVPAPPQGERVPGMIGIAQGVGITPCLSLLRTLADLRDTRAHSLLVAVRSTNDLLSFRRELKALCSSLTLALRFAVLDANAPFGATLPAADLISFLPPEDSRPSFEYVLCGPGDFVTNVYVLLLRLGVPRRRIHTETILSGSPAPLPPPPALPAGHPSAPFLRKEDHEQAPTSGDPARTEIRASDRAARPADVPGGGAHRWTGEGF